jgi:hypothetical protein
MSEQEIIIEMNGILKNIVTNPRFKDVEKYVDILADTNEFTHALAILQREIIKSMEDAKITKNEIRKISVKMFYVLKLLNDKNFKFRGLDSNKNEKLKDLLRLHMEELLTVLVVKAIQKLTEKYPLLDLVDLQEDDIELIVGTIIDTAEWSIQSLSKKCSCLPFCS